MDIIGKKYFYFLFSLLIILPGVFSLLRYNLRLSIDFTGGSLLELKLEKPAEKKILEQIVRGENIELASILASADNTYLFKAKSISGDQSRRLKNLLGEKFGKVEEKRFETVGPVIGKELAEKAAWAVFLASFMIVIYISWSFRKIPKPYSSLRFGVCAIIALIHDILVLVGLFSLFGHFFKVEIDSLFMTALLTVIGFSVHDTIVIFDRIRENLKKMPEKKFREIINESILQTLGRSLATSLTVVFTLLALLLFGGETIRWFVIALLIGIISGTYSSIFNAAPIILVWEERRQSSNSSL